MNISNLFAWQEYQHEHSQDSAADATTASVLPVKGFASQLVNQPVYISMACTSFRIASVHRVIEGIFAGHMWPDRLYLFVSSEPYLLDSGVQPSQLPAALRALAARFPLSIVFTGELTWRGSSVTKCMQPESL